MSKTISKSTYPKEKSYRCPYCSTRLVGEGRFRAHLIEDHIRHPDTGAFMASDYMPASIPKDHHIVVASNDGSYEIWEKPNCVPQTTVAGWRNFCFHLPAHRWKLAQKPANRETRYVMVQACWREVDFYAAELAAELAGISHTLALFDRQADGFFVCPHCQKKYQNAGHFKHHVSGDPHWGGCADTGAQRYIGHGDHAQRNRLSRAAWLKAQRSLKGEAV